MSGVAWPTTPTVAAVAVEVPPAFTFASAAPAPAAGADDAGRDVLALVLALALAAAVVVEVEEGEDSALSSGGRADLATHTRPSWKHTRRRSMQARASRRTSCEKMVGAYSARFEWSSVE